MTLPQLTLIPAGAGSGKTYTVQKRLGQWIRDKEVRADRILAVTFTEAAAGELRERIRGELLAENMTDEALLLQQSTISTIHSFGLQLLMNYCFEAAISPIPRLLTEDEEDSLIRQAMSETDQADAVMQNLSAFGYSYDFNSGNSAEDQFRAHILDLVNVLRVIGGDHDDAVLYQFACDYITKQYGENDEPEGLETALKAAIERLLADFPHDLSSDFPNNNTAATALRNNYRDFRQATQSDALKHDWALWNRLRKLRTSARGAPLPDGYDALAQDVMAAAEGVLSHPGPKETALVHLKAFFGAAHDSLLRHDDAKRDAGLLDYTDMLSIASHILHRDPAVLEDLVSQIDCVVIDEFQDTNPLQFSLLWVLHSAGVPALIVGDRKQAIMRFQHADARLMEALEDQHPDAIDPLTENWRTHPGLLDWMNHVGQGLFGDEYQSLAPRAAFPSTLSTLEVIDQFEKGRANTAPHHMAVRIRQLLDDPTQHCFDRRNKITRRLRGEDIAVLCPTHKLLEKYAAALRALGLRVRIEQKGWFKSRIVQLTYYALTYVADPNDRHAQLYLAVTELGQHSLNSAIRLLVDGNDIDDPLFERLDQIGTDVSGRSVIVCLDDVISALGLYDVVARWPDGQQARANLLRLRAEAEAFVKTNPESLASGGYHGGGIKTFLPWLLAQAEQEDTQPDAKVVDEDAIHLCTWHGSKGREWPIVAVCGTYSDVKVFLPDIDVQYPQFDDLDQILPNARIQYSPSFDVPEISERYSIPLQWLAVDDAERLLYVVLTRAREKILLEWPSHLEGKDKETYWSILKNKAGLELKGEQLVIGDAAFDVDVTLAGKPVPDEFQTMADEEAPADPVIMRQSILPGSVDALLTEEAISPSSQVGLPVSDVDTIIQETAASPLKLDLGETGMERGSLLHRCLEVVRGDPFRVSLLDDATGYTFTENQKDQIADTVRTFEAWVATKLKPIRVLRETPILGMNECGSVITGAIDLLIETEKGAWIIDYKSDIVENDDAKFKHYLPQLLMYRDAIHETTPVVGVGIYWLQTGDISYVQLDAATGSQLSR